MKGLKNVVNIIYLEHIAQLLFEWNGSFKLSTDKNLQCYAETECPRRRPQSCYKSSIWNQSFPHNTSIRSDI